MGGAGAHARELLTTDEYARARNSTQNAHYTSPAVIRAMWRAVDQRTEVRILSAKLLQLFHERHDIDHSHTHRA